MRLNLKTSLGDDLRSLNLEQLLNLLKMDSGNRQKLSSDDIETIANTVKELWLELRSRGA